MGNKSRDTTFVTTSSYNCKQADLYRIVSVLADFTTKIKCSSLAWFQTKPTNNVWAAWFISQVELEFISSFWVWDLTQIYYQAYIKPI